MNSQQLCAHVWWNEGGVQENAAGKKSIKIAYFLFLQFCHLSFPIVPALGQFSNSFRIDCFPIEFNFSFSMMQFIDSINGDYEWMNGGNSEWAKLILNKENIEVAFRLDSAATDNANRNEILRVLESSIQWWWRWWINHENRRKNWYFLELIIWKIERRRERQKILQ